MEPWSLPQRPLSGDLDFVIVLVPKWHRNEAPNQTSMGPKASVLEPAEFGSSFREFAAAWYLKSRAPAATCTFPAFGSVR